MPPATQGLEAESDVARSPTPLGADAAAPGALSWLDELSYRVFVDGYFNLDWAFPKPQVGPHDEVRAYDSANGFALAWAGIDVALPPAPVGGAIGLRFGPAASRYADSCLGENASCDSDIGLEFLKQAFASFRPGQGPIVLDFGKFDTIYGAETAESQDNINYTRGILYWLGQPLFHTGVRASLQATEMLAVTLLAVNGYNNTFDNNMGKTFGLQGTLRLPRDEADEDLVKVSLGYLFGPERDDFAIETCAVGQRFDPELGCVSDPDSLGGDVVVDRADSDTRGLRHFVDLVVTATPVDGLDLVLNADYGVENVRDDATESSFEAKQFWGVMLAGRYALTEQLGVGIRGEYFRDSDGLIIPRARGLDLVSGTLTLSALPTDNLVIKLDNRLDWADKQIFQESVRDTRGTLITSTLGVVVTTN
jgi:hypothetical protein